MTKAKPVELHARRGPKPKGNLGIKFWLSPEMATLVKERALQAGLSRSAWLERLLRSLE